MAQEMGLVNRSSELSAALEILRKHSPELLPLATYLAGVAINDYRWEMPSSEIEQWLRRLSNYPLEIVQQAIEELKFHPSPPDWQGMPNAVTVERVIKEQMLLKYQFRRDPECKKCDQEGFVIVQQKSRIYKNKTVRAVRKCNCWILQPKPDRALPELAEGEIVEPLNLRDVLQAAVKGAPDDAALAEIATKGQELATKMEQSMAWPGGPTGLDEAATEHRRRELKEQLKRHQQKKGGAA